MQNEAAFCKQLLAVSYQLVIGLPFCQGRQLKRYVPSSASYCSRRTISIVCLRLGWKQTPNGSADESPSHARRFPSDEAGLSASSADVDYSRCGAIMEFSEAP